MNIGQHCHLSDCKQIDFLPFKCGDCSNTFCSDHRHPIDHKCARSNSKSPNRQNHSQEHKKLPRCPVDSCKTVLTPVNEFVCQTCQQTVCLHHRYEDAHRCKNSKKMPQTIEIPSQQLKQNQQQQQQQQKKKEKSKSSFLCCFSNAKPSSNKSTQPQKKT